MDGFKFQKIGKAPTLLGRMSSIPIADAHDNFSSDGRTQLLPQEDEDMGRFPEHHLSSADVEMRDGSGSVDLASAYASNPGAATSLSLLDRVHGAKSALPAVKRSVVTAPAQLPAPSRIANPPPGPSAAPPCAVEPLPTSRAPRTPQPFTSQTLAIGTSTQDQSGFVSLRTLFSSIPSVDLPNHDAVDRLVQILKDETISTAASAQKAADLAQQALACVQSSVQAAQACLTSTAALQTRCNSVVHALEQLSKEGMSKKHTYDASKLKTIATGEAWILQREKEEQALHAERERLLLGNQKLEDENRQLKTNAVNTLLATIGPEVQTMVKEVMNQIKQQGDIERGQAEQARLQQEDNKEAVRLRQQKEPEEQQRKQTLLQATKNGLGKRGTEVQGQQVHEREAEPRHTQVSKEATRSADPRSVVLPSKPIEATGKLAVQVQPQARPPPTHLTRQQPPHLQLQEANLREKLKVRANQGSDRHDSKSIGTTPPVSPLDRSLSRPTSSRNSPAVQAPTGFGLSTMVTPSSSAILSQPRALASMPQQPVTSHVDKTIVLQKRVPGQQTTPETDSIRSSQLPSPPNSSYDEIAPQEAGNGFSPAVRQAAPFQTQHSENSGAPAASQSAESSSKRPNKRARKRKSQEWESDSSAFTINRRGSDAGNLPIDPSRLPSTQTANNRVLARLKAEQAERGQAPDVGTKPVVKEEPIDVSLYVNRKEADSEPPKKKVRSASQVAGPTTLPHNPPVNRGPGPPLPVRTIPDFSLPQSASQVHSAANAPPATSSSGIPDCHPLANVGVPLHDLGPVADDNRRQHGPPTGFDLHRGDSYVASHSLHSRSPSPSWDYSRQGRRPRRYSPEPHPAYYRNDRHYSPPPASDRMPRGRVRSPHCPASSPPPQKTYRFASGVLEEPFIYDPANLPARPANRNGTVSVSQRQQLSADAYGRRQPGDESTLNPKPTLIARIEAEGPSSTTPTFLQRLDDPFEHLQSTAFDDDQYAEAQLPITLEDRLTTPAPRGRGRGRGRGGRGAGKLVNRIYDNRQAQYRND